MFQLKYEGENQPWDIKHLMGQEKFTIEAKIVTKFNRTGGAKHP